jgi:hypothetical protein
MTFIRKLSLFTAIAAAALIGPAWSATDQDHDSHHTATTPAVQPAAPGSAGMGMGGMAATPAAAEQMKSMQQMHERMMSARTAEDRSALMAEQMKLMQDGMGMMGRMGPGTMAGKSGDLAACQGMMDQRMDMMQSMMQMMMDRMTPAPAPK